MPPLHHIPQPPTETNPLFSDILKAEAEVRRSALAPRWCRRKRHLINKKDWSAVWNSWDTINQNLHTATQKHVKRIHIMRLTHASVTTNGSWVYALWTPSETRIYIGQTGGRSNARCVGERGRDHVRLGADFLRLQNGKKLFIPANLYGWIARHGIENIIVTPLQFVPPQSIIFFVKQWMAKWGLAALLNKDLPSFQSSKWSFLSATKVWKIEIAERHGSFAATARDIIQRKKPLHPSQYPADFLLTLLSSTKKSLTPTDHRTLFDTIHQFFVQYHKAFLPYSLPLKNSTPHAI